jgi:twitching motility protein PilU
MVEQGASDLFISAGAPPMVNIDGESLLLGHEPLNGQQVHQLVYSVLDDEQVKNYEESHELNLGLNLADSARFRVNVYRQRGEPALVARYIKSHVPSIYELGLPDKLHELIMEERGLLLVVGGTGTGKSTTLASMIDYRAKNRAGHILTIEDPIEFLHKHGKSLVNQREVGIDTLSYENALKNAMREAPNVIMIGEIRDLDTMKHAMAYAKTGHLCISTLHANNANQTLDRIINFFPETVHQQVLMDLSQHLIGVISQRLANGTDGGRVPAVEIMFNTPLIRDLIQTGKIGKIKDAIEQGKGRNGQTFDEALYELNCAGKITEHEALRLADSRNNLSLRFRLEHGNDEIGTVKKDVVYDRHAPFPTYRTFKITPLKVDLSRRRDMKELVGNAIGYYLESKGFTRTNSSPDLDVQFFVGLKPKKGLSLEPIGEEVNPDSAKNSDSETHATLIVNIVDTLKQKPIWRLTASAILDDQMRTQEELNRDLYRVLNDFPPGKETSAKHPPSSTANKQHAT